MLTQKQDPQLSGVWPWKSEFYPCFPTAELSWAIKFLAGDLWTEEKVDIPPLTPFTSLLH